VLKRWGLTPPDHASRVVSAADLGAADLVLCMERAHVREAVVLDGTAWPKTFTLKELVRRASTTAPRGPRETGAEWLTRVHADRDRGDLLGSSSVDDVADPFGKRLSAYEATAAELVGLAARLIEVIWPLTPPPVK
jgi:protein-tyrosine-phosphatase